MPQGAVTSSEPYFLNGFGQAARIIADLGLPQVGQQLDLWHILRSANRPVDIWRTHGSLTRHVQIAGSLVRAEPDAVALDWITLIAPAHDGWIAAAYRPAGRTGDGLGWLPTARGTLSTD